MKTMTKTCFAGLLAVLLCAGCASGSGGSDGGDPDGLTDGQTDGQDGGGDATAQCDPACPAGSECRDLDSLGAPECVTADGELACTDGRDCPADGDCLDGVCVRLCGCASDADCAQSGDPMLCVTEDLGCGICLPRADYECESAADCLWLIDTSLCCPCPKARNTKAAEANPCLIAAEKEGQVPDGCEPDCSRVQHCWPCANRATEAGCLRGICRPGL